MSRHQGGGAVQVGPPRGPHPNAKCTAHETKPPRARECGVYCCKERKKCDGASTGHVAHPKLLASGEGMGEGEGTCVLGGEELTTHHNQY
jgi:hypothetical protein